MTDLTPTGDEAEAAARLARVEALRARRAAGASVDPPRVPPAAAAADLHACTCGGHAVPDPRPAARRRSRRRHVAQGARIAVAGVSLTGLFGLVAAMAVAEARSTQPQPTPVAAAAQPPVGVPALTVADDGRLVALPPQALTAAPQVVPVTPDPAQTVVRTNGSR